MGNSGMIAGAFSSTSGKADTVLSTNGDVLYYNSGRQRLAIGTEGKVLTVSDADLPAWETASGVTLNIQRAELGSDFTTTSASFVDVTGVTITISDNTGKYTASACINSKMASIITTKFKLLEASSSVGLVSYASGDADLVSNITIPYRGDNDGQVLKLQASSNGSVTVTVSVSANADTWLEVMEIS